MIAAPVRSRSRIKPKAALAQAKAALALSLYADIEAVDELLATCYFETELIGRARLLLGEVLGRAPSQPEGLMRHADVFDLHRAAKELLRIEAEAIWHWPSAKHNIAHAAEAVFQAMYAEQSRMFASQDSI